jgi:polyadenylate-binding protein
MAAPAGHQNASLYVGDIHPEATEAMLFDVFKEVGPVLSIRVCRDNITRRSLGYAYVNFQNPADAERALETLNYRTLRDRPIRLMWSHRDPSVRKSGSGNVFIKNLHPDIDHQTLYDTFSQFGNILSCKVSTDPRTGESRGYGFVHFESEESAKAAIEKVDKMLLKGQQVYVAKFVRRTQRVAQSQAEFSNCYIKNLKTDCSEEALRKELEKCGEIASLAVRKDNRDRVFAFCNFREHEQALKACEELNGKQIDEICNEGEPLFCSRAQKRAERQAELRHRFHQSKVQRSTEGMGQNLYVKNLDDNITDAQLREAFERFGEITSARVMMHERDPPQSKGFGFVCFKDLESANKAIAEMNGAVLGTKPLYVNVAQRKEVRRATLELQYSARMGGARGMPQPGLQQGMQPPLGYAMGPYGQPGPYGNPFSAPPQQLYGMAGQGRGMGGMGGPKWAQQGPGLPFAANPMAPMMRPVPQPRRNLGRGAGLPGAGAGRGMPGRGGPRGVGVPQGMAFNPQARNQANFPGHTPGAAGTPQHNLLGDGQEQLTPQMLAEMSAEQQKNFLGERLFARIHESQPEYAAKITGMILEMDIAEQLNLLESPDHLQAKVQEALDVLKEGTTH